MIGQHPLVTTDSDKNWLEELGFCSSGRKLRTVYDIDEIRNRIRQKYGIGFEGAMAIDVNIHTWDDLAGITRGLWLIEQALGSFLGQTNNESGRSMVRQTFSGTSVILGPDYDTGLSSSDELARLAFTNCTDALCTAAVVPPPGILGAGNKVYIRSVSERRNLPVLSNSPIGGLDRTFIHEVGHVLDFKLGSEFTARTFEDRANPSTALIFATGGRYDDSADELTCARYVSYNPSVPTNVFGVCLASRLLRSGYVPGGQPPTGYAATDHFEDFAETWENWILIQSSGFHTYTATLDSRRRVFMDSNIDGFINRAAAL